MKNLMIVFLVMLSVAAKSQSGACSMIVINERAYFYDQKNNNGRTSYTRRNAYMVYGESFKVSCKMVDRDWIYVVFRNPKGVITKGYVKSSDLELLGD